MKGPTLNISDVFSSLMSIFIDWGGFLVNKRFIRKGNEIIWEGYKKHEFADVVTASYVAKLAEYGQYSFQVGKDGSLFQIYYLYNHKKDIKSASLGFYHSGNHYYEGELLDSEELFDDFFVPKPDIQVGWLRIDYTNKSEDDGGIVHAKCHMHVSLFPDARIIVDRIPNPKQFVEFVIAICYPDEYKERRLNQAGRFLGVSKMCNVNNPLAPDIQVNDLCDYMAHLRIPTKTVPPLETVIVPPKSSKRQK